MRSSDSGQDTHVPSVTGRVLREEDAIRRALEHNQGLRAAFLDVRAARASALSAEGQYAATVTLQLSGSHTESPTATLNGTVTGRGDNGTLGVSLQKRLALGTLLAFELNGNVMEQRINPIPTSTQQITLGPLFGAELKASVTQSLLRGAGTDVGESQQRIAQLSAQAAGYARDAAASQTLRDVLLAYWELAYGSAALRVQQAHREVAEKRHDEAEQRAQLGLTAQTDVLQLATDLATLDENVIEAEAARRNQALGLGVQLGLGAEEAVALNVAEAPTDVTRPTIEEDAQIEQLLDASSELLNLIQTARIAEDSALVAEDATQARLDLSAWASLRGLADKDALGPLAQLVEANAASIFVSLELELAVDNSQRRLSLEEARMQAAAARARFEQRKLALAAELAQQREALRASERRITLSEQTVAVATELAAAERARYELGTTTALSVVSAEQEARSAELRLLRARADHGKAAVQIAHYLGELLPRYGARDYGVMQ